MSWLSMVTVSQEQVREPITANGVYLGNFTPPELVAHELCLLNQMLAAYLDHSKVPEPEFGLGKRKRKTK